MGILLVSHVTVDEEGFLTLSWKLQNDLDTLQVKPVSYFSQLAANMRYHYGLLCDVIQTKLFNRSNPA